MVDAVKDISKDKIQKARKITDFSKDEILKACNIDEYKDLPPQLRGYVSRTKGRGFRGGASAVASRILYLLYMCPEGLTRAQIYSGLYRIFGIQYKMTSMSSYPANLKKLGYVVLDGDSLILTDKGKEKVRYTYEV